MPVCLFRFTVVGPPLSLRGWGWMGWGRVAAAQATHRPLPVFPLCVPHQGPQWLLRKQGQRWHLPRTVVQGLPLFLKEGCGGWWGPLCPTQVHVSPWELERLSWGPGAHRVLQRAVFPREMADKARSRRVAVTPQQDSFYGAVGLEK